MGIGLVGRHARAFSEQLNSYYRVLKGVDADAISLRLTGAGAFEVLHSATAAAVFRVTDAGITAQIGTAALADNSVTSEKIAPNTIRGEDIATGTITSDKLVTGAPITPGSITTAEIATGGQINDVALQYVHAGDANGLAITGGTWLDLFANQQFVVDDGASIIEAYVKGVVNVQAATAGAVVASRLLVENGTIYGPLGGGVIPVTNLYVNALSGASMTRLTNPGVGTKQIRLQLYCSHAAAMFCRSASYAGLEGMSLVVMERKR